MRYFRLGTFALCLLYSGAYAVDAPSALPSNVPEPDIVIVPHGQMTLEEYRIGGQLYAIKVTPASGPVYYLVDSDGDGTFDQRSAELNPRLAIPSWVILKFK